MKSDQDEIRKAAQLLASLPDDWFDRSVIITIQNAEDESDRMMRKYGHKWRIMCRERFRAVMSAISKMDDEQ